MKRRWARERAVMSSIVDMLRIDNSGSMERMTFVTELPTSVGTPLVRMVNVMLVEGIW